MMSREEYEGRAAGRRSEARGLYSEVTSIEKIAQALYVSVHAVQSYVFR